MSKKLKGSKILVTGGAGFIGSHIVDSLVEQGANVIVYDDFSSGHLENLSKVKKQIKVIKGDILDIKSLEKATKNIDFISHMAAQLEVFKSVSNPLFDLNANTVGTLNVLQAAQKNKVKKVIVASSACVYGQPISTPQKENHPTNPNWAYGVSKLAAEKYCRIFSQDTGIPTVNLRFGIVYGPREWYRRVLTIFIKMAIEDKKVVIFGDGSQFRDFVYVGDIVKLHNLALSSPIGGNQIYNGGTAKKTSIKKLAQMVRQASKMDIKIIHENVKEGQQSKLVPQKRRNLADLEGMCLSFEKAKKELVWEPEVSLEEGIKLSMDWYKENKDRWRTIRYTD
jgi:UDP-glucose 4-epimerase